ncbi:hypothetical protein R1sor_003017 [Riccia sorocarpa]|uniref:Uncharacterized protein n=1 Tax=Riccia sorocarpa TaxID=122646 RepID=A0ABD3H3P1_9MARC
MIATTNDRLRYLGVLAGVNVSDEEISADIRAKYDKCLNHWANKILTWPEKMILCRSVLGVFPYFTLMTVGLHKQGMKALQKVTRDFLWGEVNREGKRNPCWRGNASRKKAGRGDSPLGWPPLEDMADAFLLKNVAKLIMGCLKSGSNSKKKKLKWVAGAGPHPVAASARFVMKMAAVTGTFTQHQMQKFKALLTSAKIRNTTEFQPRVSILEHTRRTGHEVDHETQTATSAWEMAFPTAQARDITWPEAAGWTWGNGTQTRPGCWKQTVKQWRLMLYSARDDSAKLNDKWEIQQTPARWRQRWKNLWNGVAQTRTKIRAWRFLRGGYFTNSKAKSWGLGDGLCARCRVEQETYLHAVWDYPRNIERSKWISWLLTEDQDRTTSNAGGEHCIDLIDRALRQHRLNQAPLLLILTTLRTNWAERNEAQFKQRIAFRGVQPVLNETRIEIEALNTIRNLSQARTNANERAKQTMEYLKEETKRWLAGAQMRNAQPAFILQNTSSATNENTQASSSAPWTDEQMIHWDHENLEDRDSNFAGTGAHHMQRRNYRRPTTTGEFLPFNEDQRALLTEMLQRLTHGWTCPPQHDKHPDRNSQVRTFDTVEQLIREITEEGNNCQRGTPM